MSKRSRLMGNVSALAVAAALTLGAAVATAADHNYASDALGDYTDYWQRTLPGGHVVTYESFNSGTFEVVSAASLPAAVQTYAAGKALRLVGTLSMVHRINFELNTVDFYPTTVWLNVMAFGGDITVDAYDSGDNLLDTYVVANGSTNGYNEFVRFDEAEIAYIELSGGSNEDWIDTLHFE